MPHIVKIPVEGMPAERYFNADHIVEVLPTNTKSCWIKLSDGNQHHVKLSVYDLMQLINHSKP